MSLALAKETVAETPEASKDHGQDAAAEDDFEKASAADDIETTAADEPAYRDGKDAEKGDVPSADHDGQEVIAAATPPPPHSIFPRSTKIFIVAMTVVSSLFSPFSNFCYIPALNVLAADLAGGSLAAIDFTVTSYQVLQGLAPMFFGDMADHAGRRPVYLLTFAIYLGANVGLALQRNYAALIVLRALQSTGSSATIAVGNGVVADIATAAERGGHVGWVQAGVQFAPALAPLLGGILAQFLGWPSIFWFLVIASGLFVVLYLLLMPETGRRIVGNGSLPAYGVNRPLLTLFRPPTDKVEPALAKADRPKRRFHVPNPLPSILIAFEKDVAVVLFFVSWLFTCFYCLIVTFPESLQQQYGFNELQVGLCYIPFSVGAMTGSIGFGRLLDYNFRRVARAAGLPADRKVATELRTFPIERARLGVVWAPTYVAAATLIAWGWMLAARAPLAVPLIITFINGVSVSGAMTTASTLLVDLYPQKPATVMASLNLTRCLLGAGGIAAVQYVVDAWGLGWTFTFLGLMVALSSPLLWVLLRFGPRWREARRVRIEERERRKAGESSAVDRK